MTSSRSFFANCTTESARGPRIALAAELTEAEVLAVVGGDRTESTVLAWDDARDDLRARTEIRAGALVLGTTDGPAPAGEAATAALVERVRATGGSVLRWTDAARTLQARLGFLHGQDPDRWPDVSDAALLATLDQWLAPLLPGATARRDLQHVDLVAALRTRLDHGSVRDLDRLAPTAFAASSQSTKSGRFSSNTPIRCPRP